MPLTGNLGGGGAAAQSTATTIKNETINSANTALRVGQLFEDIISGILSLEIDTKYQALDASAGAVTWDLNEGRWASLEATTNHSLQFSNLGNGPLSVIITAPGAARIVSFPTNVFDYSGNALGVVTIPANGARAFQFFSNGTNAFETTPSEATTVDPINAISTAVTTSTANTPTTVLTSTQTLLAGDYKVSLGFGWNCDSNATDAIFDLSKDNVSIATGSELLRLESKDNVGNFAGTQSNQRNSFYRSFYRQMAAGTYTFAMTQTSETAGVETSSWDRELTIEYKGAAGTITTTTW